MLTGLLLWKVVLGVTMTVAIYYGTFQVPEGTSVGGRLTVLLGKAQEDACLLRGWLGLGEPVLALRALVNSGKTLVPEGIQIQDLTFAGVPVRIYTPEGAMLGGAAVAYIHGGGWVMGTLDLYNAFVGDLAKHSRMVVVSIDYRLAPEHVFPAAFDDCVAAIHYLLEHASEFGVNLSRVAVAGDSAGGNLAAAVALKLRGQLKAQLLLYPTLQPFDFDTPSYQVTGPKGPMLVKSLVASCWLYYAQGHINNLNAVMANRHIPSAMKQTVTKLYVNVDAIPEEYIPKAYVKGKVDFGYYDDLWEELKVVLLNPYYAPIVATDLSGVPPGLVVTAEYDVLRDDGLLYVEKLRQSGAQVSHYHSWDGIHGMLNSPGPRDSSSAANMFNSTIKFLKDSL